MAKSSVAPSVEIYMTPAGRNKIRKLAETATPGPWQTRGLIVTRVANDEYIAGCNYARDLLFIAAANPAAMLSLLDHIDTLEAINSALRAFADEHVGPALLAELLGDT